jgi:hypothetical protein
MSGVAAARPRPRVDAQLVERAVAMLAEDPVVRASSRWRRARICLVEAGAPEQALVVDRGTVRRATGDDAAAGLPEIRIGGSREQWTPILEGRHGGLHRAWRYRELDFGGDPVAAFDLWKTVWRLGDALARAAAEARRAV